MRKRRGTPAAAMLVTTLVALALVATGTFQRLVAVVAFFLAANYVVCCLALIVLRRREPDRPRPFRAWGYPWSAALVLAGAAAFLVGAAIGDTINAGGALALRLSKELLKTRLTEFCLVIWVQTEVSGSFSTFKRVAQIWKPRRNATRADANAQNHRATRAMDSVRRKHTRLRSPPGSVRRFANSR